MSENKIPFLGCVADDVTGATDLAINLVKGGMRVVQFMCAPTQQQLENLECDAVVVALKTHASRPTGGGSVAGGCRGTAIEWLSAVLLQILFDV